MTSGWGTQTIVYDYEYQDSRRGLLQYKIGIFSVSQISLKDTDIFSYIEPKFHTIFICWYLGSPVSFLNKYTVQVIGIKSLPLILKANKIFQWKIMQLNIML